MILSYIPNIVAPSTLKRRGATDFIPNWTNAMMNNAPVKSLRRLTDLETGSSASVARIKLDAAEEARLSELGLRPGAEVRRLQGKAGQSILIGVGDGRIGVNFETARRIYVF